MEAVKTNVMGTENVLEAAVQCGVKKVICLSTDKAVYPINAMGISKAMMEKVMVAKARQLEGTATVICGTRYGNVMASRGSVIPLFVGQIKNNESITITDPKMTRFMMTLEDAVELVLFAFKNGQNGDIFVQKAPAATVELLTKTMVELAGKPKHPIKIIGTRHGEKLYETLLSREEFAVSEDLGGYYRVPADFRGLNYDSYFDKGEEKLSQTKEYNSHNTEQLDQTGMAKLLQKLPFINEFIKGNFIQPED